jgi:hypothetical protein
MGDVYRCNIFRLFSPRSLLSEVRDADDLWAYRVPTLPDAADVKARRAAAAATELAARRKDASGSGSHSRTAPMRLPPVDNEVDVVVCMTRVEAALQHAGQSGAATATRFDGAADPHVISVPFTAGAYSRPPTGKQVRSCGGGTVHRVCDEGGLRIGSCMTADVVRVKSRCDWS